jgi:Glycosyl transferase family 2
MPSATVIIHIFNEAYLLPFWLEHHRKLFDHGIVIDYHSTDNSLDLVRSMCPTWQIRTTCNENFEARAIDKEIIEDIEPHITGYKMVLNVTEFIIASEPLRDSLPWGPPKCFHLKAYAPVSAGESMPTTLDEFLTGFNRVHTTWRDGVRFIHSFIDGQYHLGRHNSSHPSTDLASNNIYLLWFGFYPWNQAARARKLQIQTKIPDSDKQRGWGAQHLTNEAGLERMRSDLLQGAVPVPVELRELIKTILCK